MGVVDLEEYDYSRDSVSNIRATEATVAERIPARVTIRRDAPIELPHILLLMDDKEDAVLGTLKKNSPSFSYKPKFINQIDGTKFVFEDNSWVLIRFSGTENVLRYYMEFSTEIECERNEKAVMNFIQKYSK